MEIESISQKCLRKQDEKEVPKKDGPLFSFSSHPDAFIPTAYNPEDTEFQSPFIPLNYGFAFCPFTLASRSRLRRYHRNQTQLFLEDQLDQTTHVLSGCFNPFATESGSFWSLRMIQQGFSSDDESEQFVETSRNNNVILESRDSGFSKDVSRISEELKNHLSNESMQRLAKAWREIAVGNSAAAQSQTGDIFERFVDEYHFMRMRSFDGYAPLCCHVTEVALGYSLSWEQAESPLIKEYNRVVGELDVVVNDLTSAEKEFREGHVFSVVAFVHAFYGLDWKGACVKAHLFYFTLLDKAEDLLAKIYSSELGKDVQLICFLEQRKFEIGATYLGGLWMMRYNSRFISNRQYSCLQKKLFPDENSQYCQSEEAVKEFNQQMTAFWATVSDPFEEAGLIGGKNGSKKDIETYSWQNQEFCKNLWLKESRVGLSGSFEGYDPKSNKNIFPDMVERFKKVYVWSGEEQWSWQRRCLHRYCERKFGSADWLTRWQKGWMPDYIKPFLNQ